ncbi:WD repeat domain-containing protein [Xylariaceae sp. FL1019]|nr:WD repeat domain-containing protein [Xylariaceae sp. FL1019]
MGKRKRHDAPSHASARGQAPSKKPKSAEDNDETPSVTFQIITGSYDRVLHGLTATVSSDNKVDFADTFLFNAHSSAIRCLAVSPLSTPEPGKAQKVMLASGSSDERINVYSISAHPPKRREKDTLSSIAPRKILENAKNRELGTLLHHESSVTQLSFPSRSKLISASEDSTIAVTRTRDWSLLSSIKVPIPKPQGRPSGDTAALGGTPAGVNSFAVHPSDKVMISVSKSERCMRLWNLMTAKKAGVLNFSRDMLQSVGESKHSSGEARKVVWGETDGSDEFCVGFDRDLIVFGMDSTPRCTVMPEPKRKIHQFCYVATDSALESRLLAVSTEDGRILFLSTSAEDLQTTSLDKNNKLERLPVAKLVAEIGGKEAGVTGRIKDFTICRVKRKGKDELFIPAGSSDGKVRLFKLSVNELAEAQKAGTSQKLGILLGTYDTQNRVTCMSAFKMIPRPEGLEDSEDEFGGELSDDDSEDEQDVDEEDE